MNDKATTTYPDGAALIRAYVPDAEYMDFGEAYCLALDIDEQAACTLAIDCETA